MHPSIKIIGAILLFLVLAIVVTQSEAQTVEIKTTDKVLKDTTISGKTYQLYIGSKGGRYIIATSSKTGKQYKRYFKK